MVKRALELDISFLADIQSGGQHLVVRRILSIRPSLPRLVADKAVALVGVGAAQVRASGPPGPARAGPSSLFGDDGRGGRAAGRCGPIGIGLLLGALCGTRRALCTATLTRVRACAASKRDTRHGQQAVSSQPQRTPSPTLSPASSTSSRRREAGFGARPTGCPSKMEESRHFKTQARHSRRCWCSDLTSGGHGAPRRVRRGCFGPARAPPPRPRSAP